MNFSEGNKENNATNLVQVIAGALFIAVLVSFYYLRRYMDELKPIKVTIRASTFLFVLAAVAFLSAVLKPAQVQISNWIFLAIVAALIVMALHWRSQEK